MPTSKPAHHTSRTLLLASDCKNTVIAEMAGSIHHLAYSPYGQQSSRQEVMTQLGFNGERREAKIEGYALGNGYRVYNPRLMRFHSPDKSSPFEKGGMNTYMYCGGEPVMNVDPTGRSFWSKLLNIWDFLSLSNTSSGPRRNALLPQKGSGESGLLNVAGGIVENAQMNRRPPIVPAGGKGRRHAAPTWKGEQAHSNPVTTSPATSTEATTPNAAQNGGLSRQPSRRSVSSHSSSASTPSTVSTVSSISNHSADSGYASSTPGSNRSNASADDRLQVRLNNLRQR
jgi:RHS repeat-associated protein